MAGYRSALCCHFCRCLQKLLCVDTDSLFDVPDILVHYIWREVNLSFFFNIQTGIYSLTIIKMPKTLSKNRRGVRSPTPVIQPLYSYNCKLNELIPLSAPFLDWECLCCQASYPASMLWSKLLSNKNIATGSQNSISAVALRTSNAWLWCASTLGRPERSAFRERGKSALTGWQGSPLPTAYHKLT